MSDGASEVRVHIATHMSEEHQQELQAVSPRVRLTYRPAIPYLKPTELDPELRPAEVLIGYHAYFGMTDAPRLRWLQLSSDGADHLRSAPIMRSGVIVTNARVFATPIAEYTFGSILSWSYRFPQARERFQRQRLYPRNQWEEYRSTELCSRTLAIIGYGAIGQRVATLARAFEMKVIATRRTATERAFVDGVEIHPADQLREVLARADVVVVCLPLTGETEGLIGEEELRAMKPSAYLVSVGRGSVIEEGALLRALREGWIAGAGIDVFAQRPLPPDSPFFDLPNVIMTPHMSGISDGYESRSAGLFRDNLRRYLAGEELVNVVDKEKGY